MEKKPERIKKERETPRQKLPDWKIWSLFFFENLESFCIVFGLLIILVHVQEMCREMLLN